MPTLACTRTHFLTQPRWPHGLPALGCLGFLPTYNPQPLTAPTWRGRCCWSGKIGYTHKVQNNKGDRKRPQSRRQRRWRTPGQPWLAGDGGLPLGRMLCAVLACHGMEGAWGQSQSHRSGPCACSVDMPSLQATWLLSSLTSLFKASLSVP